MPSQRLQPPPHDIADNGKKSSTVQGPTSEQFADLSRRTGDTSVYLYYLKSIGFRYSVLAAAIILSHLFAVNFPRIFHFANLCLIYANTFAEIWLKWYAEGTISSSGTFIGVYVLLVALAIGGKGAMIW
jgi:ATP-binding cassette subfamily C (CFTR/MRP) protein 1